MAPSHFGGTNLSITPSSCGPYVGQVIQCGATVSVSAQSALSEFGEIYRFLGHQPLRQPYRTEGLIPMNTTPPLFRILYQSIDHLSYTIFSVRPAHGTFLADETTGAHTTLAFSFLAALHTHMHLENPISVANQLLWTENSGDSVSKQFFEFTCRRRSARTPTASALLAIIVRLERSVILLRDSV
jgi:hypothetical protein